MVRHEAAEALGAIGLPVCMAQLERYAGDSCREVAETCELALGRIRYWATARSAAPGGEATLGSRKEQFSAPLGGGAAEAGSPYLSIDPVPPAAPETAWEALRETLLDEQSPMFERYRALFALRNRGGAAAAAVCCEALGSSGSALLKHELCYVLGQLQQPGAADTLHATLTDTAQHAMVRHEAAEALGSIAGGESKDLLVSFLADIDPIVAEGCQVALDILDYEQSGAFEYCAV